MIFDPLDKRILGLAAAHDTARRALNRWLSYQTGLALIDDIDKSLGELGMSESARERKFFDLVRLARGSAPGLYFGRSTLRRLFAEAESAREMVLERRTNDAEKGVRAWAEKKKAGRAA